MNDRTIIKVINGINIYENSDGSISYTTCANVDGDGSPYCYAPLSSGLSALDFLANAGNSKDGWWGIVTIEGTPYINPSTGYYVSTTSLQLEGKITDQNRYINSEIVPYIVVPSSIVRSVKGVVLGCKVLLTNTENSVTIPVVCADIGPNIGELSMAAASQLGLPNSPKNGGTEKHIITYQIFPGIAADGFSLQPS